MCRGAWRWCIYSLLIGLVLVASAVCQSNCERASYSNAASNDQYTFRSTRVHYLEHYGMLIVHFHIIIRSSSSRYRSNPYHDDVYTLGNTTISQSSQKIPREAQQTPPSNRSSQHRGQTNGTAAVVCQWMRHFLALAVLALFHPSSPSPALKAMPYLAWQPYKETSRWSRGLGKSGDTWRDCVTASYSRVRIGE